LNTLTAKVVRVIGPLLRAVLQGDRLILITMVSRVISKTLIQVIRLFRLIKVILLMELELAKAKNPDYSGYSGYSGY
jgi:hypothetical protein